MINLSKAAAGRDRRVIQKFTFAGAGVRNPRLEVSIEYVPREVLTEEQKREETKTLSTRRFNAAVDVQAANDALQRAFNRILADRVMKIEGLTAAKLAGMIDLDPKLTGSQMSDEMDLDDEFTLDASGSQESLRPLTDEDRKRLQLDPDDDCKTYGDFAKKQILYLVSASFEFRNFVESIVSDVGNFQRKSWEDELKNSRPGANSSSAK